MFEHKLIMVVKTITITEEAYNALKRLKKEEESFSEVVLRLTTQKNGQNLRAFLGAWDISDDEILQVDKALKNAKGGHYKSQVNFD